MAAVEGAVAAAQQGRDWYAWWTVFLGILLLAYLGNPTPASFRTHLTSLSFYTHLRRLSSPSASPSRASPKDKSASSSHVLSFSNRISLSVRTPPYKLHSYGLFSIVVMAPSQSSEAMATSVEGEEVWIGAFGRWYAWRGWASLSGKHGMTLEEIEDDERRGRLRRGVKGMVREDADEAEADSTLPSPVTPVTAPSPTDDEPPLSPTTRSASTPATRNPRSTKRIFRAGQRRASPNSLARLRSKAEASSAAGSAAASGDSSTCTTPPLIPEGSDTHQKQGSGEWDSDAAFADQQQQEEGKGPPQMLPGHFALATAVSAEDDPVLVELKMQVEELKTATTENERRLQEELEVLRGKKKEEDNFRAELKAKTKVLEEQKRVAELHRVEADRELGERKGAEREVKERVEKMRSEIGKIEKRKMEVEERKEKKRRDRREREKKLKDDVGKKKEELKGVEDGVEELMDKVRGLERAVEGRRELLMSKRNEMTARSMGFGSYANGLPALGHNASVFRRPTGPLTAPFSGLMQPTSRPSSIRSGYAQHYTSAPSSPILAPANGPHAVSPLDDNASYSEAATKFYGGAFAPEPYRPTAALNQQGFLEHRMQHRRAEQALNNSPGTSLIQPGTNLNGTLPSADDISTSFLPFDFDSYASSSDHISPFNGSSTRPPSLYSHDDPTRASSTGAQSRPQLALPLQYLDSGLLAGSESPSMENGPLSPMTPHQTSLIPSQLFQMLDEDEDDEGGEVYEMPESPTYGPGGGRRGLEEWKGLGLDLDDVGLSYSKAAAGGGSGQGSSKEGSESGAATTTAAAAAAARRRDASLSPRLVSPVIATSSSSSASPRPHPLVSPSTTSASDSASAPSPVSSAATYSPWDPVTSRLSPQPTDLLPASASSSLLHLNLAHSAADDLPRAGLSLNPDAKAFAFEPRSSPTGVLPPPIGHGHGHGHGVRSSSTGSASAGSPTGGVFSLGGQKSRMDFSSTNGHGLGHQASQSLGGGSRFDFGAKEKERIGERFNPFGDA